MSNEVLSKTPEAEGKPASKYNLIHNVLVKEQQKELIKIGYVHEFSWGEMGSGSLTDDVRIGISPTREEFNVNGLNVRANELSDLLKENGINGCTIKPAEQLKDELNFGWVETEETVGIDRMNREIFVKDSKYDKEGLMKETPLKRGITIIIYPNHEVALAAYIKYRGIKGEGPTLSSIYSMTQKEIRKFSKTSH